MMRHNTVVSTLIFGGAVVSGSSDIIAQTVGLEYTTEWQTDFDGGYDWLNLLKVSTELPVSDGITFEAAAISVAKTGDSPLLDDLLTYSNIEAGNIPLTFSRLGFGFETGKAKFFAGINNVNEDYFTSDLTSFFSNSPCGISPTISCNYDIANYPVAAWCVHYSQQMGSFTLQTSLYPGKGYSRLAGHDNLFSLNIKRDGIFSISSIDYKRNGIYSVMGVALHHGVCIGDDDAEQEETQASTAKKRFTAAPWMLTEVKLPCNLGFHAHASFSTVESGCKAFAGIGVLYDWHTIMPGMSVNKASFSSTSETSVEFTCRIPLLHDKAYLQPAIHLVRTNHGPTKCVGMLRFNLSL